jgi:hypothetical protein
MKNEKFNIHMLQDDLRLIELFVIGDSSLLVVWSTSRVRDRIIVVIVKVLSN